jgi:hypothetical protein
VDTRPPQGSNASQPASQKPGDPSDPATIMATLRQQFQDKPAFAWLDHFSIVELGQQQVTLAPTPGQRGLLRMVTDGRKQQLAEQLGEILGRSVRVQLREPGEGPAAQAGPDESSGAGASHEAKSARQAAMNLPLVREVFEQFPNAALTDVQRSTAGEAAPADDPAAPDVEGDDPDDDAKS